MANFGIKPTRSSAGVIIAGQALGVTSAAVAFSAFNSSSEIVVVQFRGGDVYATFDGTVPSASSGFQLYAAKAFHWDVNTAKMGKFVQVSGGVTAYAQEFQIYFGDSQIPDTSVVKSLASP